MATLTVRDIDDDLKTKLRIRAAENGRSMEAEVREILRVTLEAPEPEARGIGTRIHRRFQEVGGVNLVIPPRSEELERPLPDFDQ